MQQWLSDGSIQLGCVFALRCLLEAKLRGASQRHLPRDTRRIVASSLAHHPGLRKLQQDGAQLQRLLGEVWEEDVVPLGPRQTATMVVYQPSAPPFHGASQTRAVAGGVSIDMK